MTPRKPIRRDTDWNAPLPLAYRKALAKGLELRALPSRPPFGAIADVMRIYHGFDRAGSWWQKHLLAAGAEPIPRGFNAINRGTGERRAA
jgi:hypothetical protein